MSGFWKFISQKRNREVLGWLGGGFVVLATGLWAATIYFFPAQKASEPKPVAVEASCSGVAVGGNVSGATINTGSPRDSDCSTKPK